MGCGSSSSSAGRDVLSPAIASRGASRSRSRSRGTTKETTSASAAAAASADHAARLTTPSTRTGVRSHSPLQSLKSSMRKGGSAALTLDLDPASDFAAPPSAADLADAAAVANLAATPFPLTLDQLRRCEFTMQLSSEAHRAMRGSARLAAQAQSVAAAAAMRSCLDQLQQLYSDFNVAQTRHASYASSFAVSVVSPPLTQLPWLSSALLQCKNTLEPLCCTNADPCARMLRTHAPFATGMDTILSELGSMLRATWGAEPDPCSPAASEHDDGLALFVAFRDQRTHELQWMQRVLVPFHVLKLQSLKELQHPSSSLPLTPLLSSHKASRAGTPQQPKTLAVPAPLSISTSTALAEWIRVAEAALTDAQRELQGATVLHNLLSSARIFGDAPGRLPSLSNADGPASVPSSAFVLHECSVYASQARHFAADFCELLSRVDAWLRQSSALAAQPAATKGASGTSGASSSSPSTPGPFAPLLLVQLPSGSLSSLFSCSFPHRILAVHRCRSLASANPVRALVLDLANQLLATFPSAAVPATAAALSYAGLVRPIIEGAVADDSPSAAVFADLNDIELFQLLVAGPLAMLAAPAVCLDEESPARFALVLEGLDEVAHAALSAAGILHPGAATAGAAGSTANHGGAARDSLALRDASSALSPTSPSRNFRADKLRSTQASQAASAAGSARNPYLLFLAKALHMLPSWLGVIAVSSVPVKATLRATAGSTNAAGRSMSPNPLHSASPTPNDRTSSPLNVPGPAAEVSLSTLLRRFQPLLLDYSAGSWLSDEALAASVSARLSKSFADQPLQPSSEMVALLCARIRSSGQGLRYAHALLDYIDARRTQSQSFQLSSEWIQALPQGGMFDLFSAVLSRFHQSLSSSDASWARAFSAHDPSALHTLIKLLMMSSEPLSLAALSALFNGHLTATATLISMADLHAMLRQLEPLLALSGSGVSPRASSSSLSSVRVRCRSVSVQNFFLQLHFDPRLKKQLQLAAAVLPLSPAAVFGTGSKHGPRIANPMAGVRVREFNLLDFSCDPAALHTQWAHICWDELQQRPIDHDRPRHPDPQADDDGRDEFEHVHSASHDQSCWINSMGDGSMPMLRVGSLYPRGPTFPPSLASNGECDLLAYAITHGPSHAILAHTMTVSPVSSSSDDLLDPLLLANQFLSHLQYIHLRFALDRVSAERDIAAADGPGSSSRPILVDYQQAMALMQAKVARFDPPVPAAAATALSATAAAAAALDAALSDDPPTMSASIVVPDPPSPCQVALDSVSALASFIRAHSLCFREHPWLVYPYALSYPESSAVVVDSAPVLSPVWHQVQQLSQCGWFEQFCWPLVPSLSGRAARVEGGHEHWAAWCRWRNKPTSPLPLLASVALRPLSLAAAAPARVHAVSWAPSGTLWACAGESASASSPASILIVNALTNHAHVVILTDAGNGPVIATSAAAAAAPSSKRAPASRITALRFTADSKHLLSLHSSPAFTGLKMWELNAGRLVSSLPIAPRSGNSLQSPLAAGKRAAAAAAAASQLPSLTATPTVLEMSPDGGVVAVSGPGCPLLLVTLQSKSNASRVGGGGLGSPSSSSSASALAAGPSLRVQQSLQSFNKDIFAVAYSPMNYDVCANDGHEMLRLWDSRTGKMIRSIVVQASAASATAQNNLAAITFSKDGECILVAVSNGAAIAHSSSSNNSMADREVRIYNYSSGLFVHSLKFPSPVTALLWAPSSPLAESRDASAAPSASALDASLSAPDYFLTLVGAPPFQVVQLWSFRSKPFLDVVCLASTDVSAGLAAKGGGLAPLRAMAVCEGRNRFVVGGDDGVARVYELQIAQLLAQQGPSLLAPAVEKPAAMHYTFQPGSSVAVLVARKPPSAAAQQALAMRASRLAASNSRLMVNSQQQSPGTSPGHSPSHSTGSIPRSSMGNGSKYLDPAATTLSPSTPTKGRMFADVSPTAGSMRPPGSHVSSQRAPVLASSSLPSHRTTSLSFAPNSRRLLASCWDSSCRVYDLTSVTPGHGASIGAALSTASNTEHTELQLRIECDSGLFAASWITPPPSSKTGSINSGASGAAGSGPSSHQPPQPQVLSCSYTDATIASIWSAADGSLVRQMVTHKDRDGTSGASFGGDANVDDEGALLMFTAAATSPNSRWLACRREYSGLGPSGREEVFLFELYSPRSAGFMGFRRRVLTCFGQASLAGAAAPGAKAGDILSLAFSADSLLLASCSTNGTMHVGEVETGLPVRTFEAAAKRGGADLDPAQAAAAVAAYFTCARFSPDARFLLAGLSTGAVHCYSLESGSLVLDLPDAHSSCHSSASGGGVGVSSVDYTRDGLYFLSAGAHDGQVKLWRAGDQTLLTTLQIHANAASAPVELASPPTVGSSEICAAVFSPDSQWVAVAGAHKSVCLFSLGGGGGGGGGGGALGSSGPVSSPAHSLSRRGPSLVGAGLLGASHGGHAGAASGHGHGHGFLTQHPRPPPLIRLMHTERMQQSALVVCALLSKGPGAATSPAHHTQRRIH